ncbi:MAG: PKD domain-containing protein [Candidatus Saccharibacteria bacterium]
MSLCPHAHSARKLENHHTSYFALSVLLVVVGFALGATTITASAAQVETSGGIGIEAQVTGSSPMTAPTILQPLSDQSFSRNPIVFSGECTPTMFVEVRKNGYLAGTARCKANGTYSMQIDLIIGLNKLVARQYNGSGYGPVSSSVIVMYKPNIAPVPTPQSQLIIQSDIPSQAIGLGQELSWVITVVGGTPPYALSWDWGDGTIDLKSIDAKGEFTMTHAYQKAGEHAIVIKLTDHDGQVATLDLAEYTTGKSTPITGTTTPIDTPGYIFALWPIYGLLICIVWAFYIGERFGEKRERKHSHLAH